MILSPYSFLHKAPAMPKTPLGKLPREAIRMLELPRLPHDVIEGYKVLVDLTGTISDASLGAIYPVADVSLS